jgi:preprotein translocase subunit SecG
MQLMISIFYALGCVILIALLFLTQGEENDTSSSFATNIFRKLSGSQTTITMAQRLIALLFVGLIATNVISKRIVLQRKALLVDTSVITAQDLISEEKKEQPSATPLDRKFVVPKKSLVKQRKQSTIGKAKR